MKLLKESKVIDKYWQYHDTSKYIIITIPPSYSYSYTTYTLELEDGEKKRVSRSQFHSVAIGDTVSYIPEKTQDILIFFLLGLFFAIILFVIWHSY